jgi:hypothetical protein
VEGQIIGTDFDLCDLHGVLKQAEKRALVGGWRAGRHFIRAVRQAESGQEYFDTRIEVSRMDQLTGLNGAQKQNLHTASKLQLQRSQGEKVVTESTPLDCQLTPARTHKAQVVIISAGSGLACPRCGFGANLLREAKKIGMRGPKPPELLVKLTS